MAQMLKPPQPFQTPSLMLGTAIGFLFSGGFFNVIDPLIRGTYNIFDPFLGFNLAASLAVGLIATLIHSYKIADKPRVFRSAIPFILSGFYLWTVVVTNNFVYFPPSDLILYLPYIALGAFGIGVGSFVIAGIWQWAYATAHNALIRRMYPETPGAGAD